MKDDDKPFWGPVGKLLAQIGQPFCFWPPGQRSQFVPIVVKNSVESVNDDTFRPPPTAA